MFLLYSAVLYMSIIFSTKSVATLIKGIYGLIASPAALIVFIVSSIMTEVVEFFNTDVLIIIKLSFIFFA
ncbi:hypothetical protein GLOIN_2v1589869 [Rhizophagus irregularis DAOM 181602=DAOM 197198]|uniref:Uncharacterized protein n=1 Tax=Rhizophagus irregularis (strain DAOM 181602 / DAOM 197198 / MUCL 43194) TaxID=747089 RepID=A0A2P4Q693_RHIID|nr:hypothetical protein GLOIN_2v1589869 [Rhizophagus irregularis DAOM 181602=DAOM 197198]POG73163.1 hypothetical protein GLOIN_2v1589869 [Rhizophagus irregularis DAOM 181602=DAOM 197198]GET50987.1 hypothetical protein GLOIN_2v1589869 [Rhizophagus irregularis DAOM 181602=DAOM 197198]|eukprot:XP_025180029.1 hypothetical protein GLOIN_2v1589869 [Rhizophagus irregularis DAOM 181602=DAOM 197198]